MMNTMQVKRLKERLESMIAEAVRKRFPVAKAEPPRRLSDVIAECPKQRTIEVIKQFESANRNPQMYEIAAAFPSEKLDAECRKARREKRENDIAAYKGNLGKSASLLIDRAVFGDAKDAADIIAAFAEQIGA